jgi:hypothetical protein
VETEEVEEVEEAEEKEEVPSLQNYSVTSQFSSIPDNPHGVKYH